MGAARAGLLALLFYLALTALFLFSLFPEFSAAFPAGEGGERSLWLLWWARRAPGGTEGSLFFTPFLYHPAGASLAGQEWSLLGVLLAAGPLRAWGEVAAYNLVLLVSFPVGALGGFLLAHHLTKSRGAALLAGALYAFGPAHMGSLGHGLAAASQGFLPFAALTILRARESPTIARGALAGLVGGLTFLSGDEFFFMMTLLGGFCLLCYKNILLKDASPPWPCGGAALLLFLLPGVPRLGALLAEVASQGSAHLRAASALGAGADLATLLLPSPLHPLWGGSPWAAGLSSGALWLGPGYVALLLGAAGFILVPKSRPWALLALAAAALALGGELRVGGREIFSPLSYKLLYEWTPWGLLGWQPSRHAHLLSLAFSLLAAWGYVALAGRMGGSGPRRGLLLLALALFLFESWPGSLSLARLPDHPAYREAAKSAGAILELPLELLGGGGPRQGEILAQLVHQRPRLAGSLLRVPPAARRYLTEGVLEELDSGRLFPLEKGRLHLEGLRRLGVGVILVRERAFRERRGERGLRDLLSYLHGAFRPRLHRSEGLAWMRLD